MDSQDISAWLASLTTLALVLVVGALVSGVAASGAQARAWAPLDVTWTQSLHEEIKVATDRFTGGAKGDRPDWIAAHCGHGSPEPHKPGATTGVGVISGNAFGHCSHR